MENAVEALKIAFAVLMFVMALTLSISSFSKVRETATSIIKNEDRETEYTYVEPSENLTRTVGIETVVSSMYRAFEENIEIYFMKSDGKTPIALYYDLSINSQNIEVTSIDLEKEGFATQQAAKEHLDIILGGNVVLNSKGEDVKDKYRNKIIHNDGLYDYFKNARFEELLGEFYKGEGASKIKKRVITYILQ